MLIQRIRLCKIKFVNHITLSNTIEWRHNCFLAHWPSDFFGASKYDPHNNFKHWWRFTLSWKSKCKEPDKMCYLKNVALFSSPTRSRRELCYYPGVSVRTWWTFLFQILYLSYYFAKLAWMVHLHLIMDLKDWCLFVIFGIYIMIEYCILFLCSTYYCITLYLIIWCSSIQCCVIWYNIV